MSTTLLVRGSIPEIVRNDEGLYPGDLISYFKVVFHKAKNCNYPYHNFRHMTHVFWLCYGACQYYQGQLNPRERRDLLIGGLFHDFDHSGVAGHDDLNIQRAIRGLKEHIQPEDEEAFEDIAEIIRPTEYPYKVASDTLPLSAQILRDADLSQAMNPAWIQQVIFGLAGEWGTKPIEVLRSQASFLGQLYFSTDWAKQLFPPEIVQAKIEEAKQLLALLE